MLKYLIIWLGMPFIAILNATIREILFVKSLNEKAAHRLSVLTIIILLSVYLCFILNKYRFENLSQAMWTGIMWVVLTVGFEFSLGALRKRPLSELLSAYNIFSGDLWLLVPSFILIAPILFYKYFQK